MNEIDSIMTKARNIIETGRGERLNCSELKGLKEFGGVVFVAYEKALDLIDNKEIGGNSYER